MAKGKAWKGKGKGKGDSKPKLDKPKLVNKPSGGKWVEEFKNEAFEQYYKMQNIISAEEWPTFMRFLREPLPTTFRLAGSTDTAHELNDIIQKVYVPQLSDVTFEESKLSPPVQLPWYPDGLAWHLNVPKAVLRRSPEFKRFHNFLVYETDVGNVSRQEAVSMIPPLFLDVKPHHTVMDMCAAPGSKTAQIIEAMHTRDPTDPKSNTHMPQGLIVANDSDFKRTHLLVHQSSRLPSPALMVTNLDASNYPNLFVAPPSSDPSAPVDILKFDRILCDVPCSGDGTLRKNLAIWDRWQPMDGNGLHVLQLRILLRGMKLLKPNGRIVYSTCSLNPIENEAVVAAALKAELDFELVDVSDHHLNLIRKPGIDAWTPVVNKGMETFSTFEDYVAHWKSTNEKPGAPMKLTSTHWPPPDATSLHLDRCMRIYPHLQDMGGFFVAVLQRKEPSSSSVSEPITGIKRAPSVDPEAGPDSKRLKKESPIPIEDINISDAQESNKINEDTKAIKGKSQPSKSPKKDAMKDRFKEAPYTFLGRDNSQLQQAIERLSLSFDFPVDNVFVRNPDITEANASDIPLRSLYICNDILKRVILANDYTKIRMVSAGTKVFTRQDAGLSVEEGDTSMIRQQFRVLDDALPIALPFIPPSTIYPARLCDLKLLLQSYYPLMSSFQEPFRSLLGSKALGNQLVRFEQAEEDGGMLNRPMVLTLWKSNVSIALMLDKKSKSALSLRVFGEDITIFGKEMHEKQKASQERREAAATANHINDKVHSEREHYSDKEVDAAND